MIILGLHFGHDASLCVLRDGKVIAFREKERHVRIKHALGLDADDIHRILDVAGLSLTDIDQVALTNTQYTEYVFVQPERLRFVTDFDTPSVMRNLVEEMGADLQYWPPRISVLLAHKGSHYQKMFRQYHNWDHSKFEIFPSVENFAGRNSWNSPRKLDQYRAADCSGIFRDDMRLGMHLPIRLTVDEVTIPGAIISHHMAHAYYGYFESPFRDAAILTHDGAWDGHGTQSGLLLYAQDGMIGPIAPHQLWMGAFYDFASVLVGFDLVGGAGKLMGLAAYGKPTFYQPHFVGNCHDNGQVTNQFAQHVRTEGARLGYDLSALGDPSRATDPINADVAASAQRIFEETILKTADVLADALRRAGIVTENLVLSGGAALNCPTNTRLIAEGPFKRLFVPPGCIDSGLSIGAALGFHHVILGNPWTPRDPADYPSRVYLGHVPDDREIEEAIRAVDKAVQAEKPADVCGVVAGMLADGLVVGWVQGASELGPRALGHRSILADPRSKENWRRVNIIKRREQWRPLAPAVLDTDLERFFTGAPDDAHYMLINAKVTTDALPAITHVDGTARVQVVTAREAKFHGLLTAFRERTGVGVLMNTSLNGPGEPICETAADAVRFFLSSELDALVLGDHIVTRR